MIGLLIQRKVFSIIGLLGAIEYIIYLETTAIKDNTTLLTSMILITGLMILYLGVLYNKKTKKWEKVLEDKLPQKIRMCLPKNRNKSRTT